LLLDQPLGEASATGTPITSKNEIAINANTAYWKEIVMVVILQAPNKLNRLYHSIPNFQFSSNALWKGFDHKLIEFFKLFQFDI
jgi:hypothetical protein